MTEYAFELEKKTWWEMVRDILLQYGKILDWSTWKVFAEDNLIVTYSLRHNPDFKRRQERRLLKTFWEKEKMLVTSISPFSQNVSYSFRNKFQVFSHIYFVI